MLFLRRFTPVVAAGVGAVSWADDAASEKMLLEKKPAVAAGPRTDGWVLRQLHLNTRHGDRAPRQEVPKIPSKWPVGLAQVTPLGMRQSYSLGRAIDAEYGDLWKHRFNEKIKIRASSRDRSITSAYCLSAGLFPLGTGPVSGLPFRQQAVPVASTDYWNDILFHACDRCPELNARREKFCESEEFKAKERAAAPALAKLREITGVEPSLVRLYPVFDSLSCMRASGQYDLAKEDPELWEEVLELAHWSETSRFSSRLGGDLQGGPMIQAIDYQMELAVRGKKAKDVVIYNGHDSTMLSVVAALKLDASEPERFKKIPGLCSCLAIELWERPTPRFLRKLKVEHAVRVVYRRGVEDGAQGDVPPEEPWVPLKLRGKELCSLDEWRQVVKEAVPEDWCQACRNTTCNACAQRFVRLTKLRADASSTNYERLAALEKRIAGLRQQETFLTASQGHSLSPLLDRLHVERSRLLEELGASEDEYYAQHAGDKAEADAKRLQFKDIVPNP